ncbi:MAG: DUF5060 domain-containing protein, partial [Bacteroidales bacterium]
MKKLLLLSVIFLCYIPVKGQKVEKWKIFELELKGAKVENPFTDVQLSAEFTYKNRSFYVDGFYDGDQTYKIRFMPNEEGEWRYKTSSNVKVLNNKTGTFECTPASEGNHGPVRVRDTFHFGYADGTPFYPLGTTAYAWVHQEKELRRQTIETLTDQDFNKIRMTVMPKQYGKYIQNEPPYYPFEGS